MEVQVRQIFKIFKHVMDDRGDKVEPQCFNKFTAGLQSLWITSWCSSDLYRRKHLAKNNRHRKEYDDFLSRDRSHEILETKFINNSLDNMDDMVFENNNKNAIYVLNTSYNTYGEFGRPNAFGYPQISSDEIYNYPKTCSLSRSLHKLKSLRHHSNEMISGSGSNSAERYSSSPTTYCSPAATALQKLFNCSNTADGCKSINLKNSNNNNNCHTKNSHISSDLSHNGSRKDHQHQHRYSHQETGKQQYIGHPQLEYHHLPLSLRSNSNGGNKSTSCASCVLPCVSNNSGTGTGKKKHSNSTVSVKSTLIAKKTKFWKYLVEEEKWRKHSVENLSTTNCERDCGRSLLSNAFGDGNNQSSANCCSGVGRSTHTKRGATSNDSSKSKSNSANGNDGRTSNWSGSVDNIKSSNNNSYQKSSAELYKEAAQLLGLSCTLCDNCRCLDCQSRYFECDDSDSYSEFSFMDEYYETLQDVDRNLKHLHSRHFSSPSLQHTQEDEFSLNDDHHMNTELETNLFDHCESFNDLSLENSLESED